MTKFYLFGPPTFPLCVKTLCLWVRVSDVHVCLPVEHVTQFWVLGHQTLVCLIRFRHLSQTTNATFAQQLVRSEEMKTLEPSLSFFIIYTTISVVIMSPSVTVGFSPQLLVCQFMKNLYFITYSHTVYSWVKLDLSASNPSQRRSQHTVQRPGTSSLSQPVPWWSALTGEFSHYTRMFWGWGRSQAHPKLHTERVAGTEPSCCEATVVTTAPSQCQQQQALLLVVVCFEARYHLYIWGLFKRLVSWILVNERDSAKSL